MYFSHPECLHYSGTRSVCFINANFVYPFQSPRMSPLFRDTECLLSNWKMCLSISVTRSVSIILGLGVSTLVWDKDCLLCSGTQCPKVDRVSFLLCHGECLPCYGICLHYYCMVSLLVCLLDLSTLFSVLSSLLLAPKNLYFKQRKFFHLFWGFSDAVKGVYFWKNALKN